MYRSCTTEYLVPSSSTDSAVSREACSTPLHYSSPHDCRGAPLSCLLRLAELRTRPLHWSTALSARHCPQDPVRSLSGTALLRPLPVPLRQLHRLESLRHHHEGHDRSGPQRVRHGSGRSLLHDLPLAPSHPQFKPPHVSNGHSDRHLLLRDGAASAYRVDGLSHLNRS